MVLSDALLVVASIMAILGIFAATVAFSKHLGDVLVDKLDEAENLRFQNRRRSLSARQRKDVAEQQVALE